jgi:hypothetical protein
LEFTRGGDFALPGDDEIQTPRAPRTRRTTKRFVRWSAVGGFFTEKPEGMEEGLEVGVLRLRFAASLDWGLAEELECDGGFFAAA